MGHKKAKSLNWKIEKKSIDNEGNEKVEIVSMPEIWQTDDFARFVQDENNSLRFAEIFLD